MFRKLLFMVIFSCLFNQSIYADQQKYNMDEHAQNWTAFHYSDEKQHITSCFVLSNDLVLGFKSDVHNVGLFIWDAKGQQKPGLDKKVAITIGKEHLLFLMKAMDQNMLMNRLKLQDFQHLLQKLSYADIAIVEYGQQPVNVVDLSGLPVILSKFRHCITQAGFKTY